ncbi:glycosyltransferase family 10 [Niveispirillum sp. BGYR6]|uniref:glycosyltransferase family 10 domain-containing protein n=1 Tax=Niveispirillum sp. BGYR6 TaxID=2971249 RepID=UPI0022B9B9BE|nr:glycosyltransferase family 10 [Niveispirillum sp. BGYR6]MDG5497465.1 glycosyltransferase family 10 [Niveispirillum sp. BGYR6]
MLTTVLGASWLVLDLPFPCEIHCREIYKTEDNDKYKVLFMHTEPLDFCINHDLLSESHKYFDLIISCHPQHLNFSNSVFDVYGGIWVKSLPQLKSFSVSFLYSLGLIGIQVNGYAERTGVMENADKINIPKRFYRSRRVPPGVADHLPHLEGDRKDQLFESMFHVCIENTRHENYFTEKLCDCFATYTIPIYYGCPNISKYFNMDGIIVADSHAHAVEIINNLSPADYWRRMDAMRDNFRRSQRYWDWVGRLRSLILREHTKANRLLTDDESQSL